MYSLLRERNQFKHITLQALLLGTAGFMTEKFVEILVEEKNLLPESFALESIVFLVTWFGLDQFFCSIFKSRSVLQSFTDRVVAKRSLITLALSWITAVVFFKFYSFSLELFLMFVLWFLLDFLSDKLGRKTH